MKAPQFPKGPFVVLSAGPYTITYYFADGTEKREDSRSEKPDVEKMAIPDGVSHLKIDASYPMEHRILRSKREEMEKKAGPGNKISLPTMYFLEADILNYTQASQRVNSEELPKLREAAESAIKYAQTFMGKDKEATPEDMYYIHERALNVMHVFADNCAVLHFAREFNDGKTFVKTNRLTWNEKMRVT